MKMIKKLAYAAAIALVALAPLGCGDARDDGRIVITGNDQMRFSPTEFSVPAGSEVVLVFKNVGSMPIQAMGHNLLILKQGTEIEAFARAGRNHKENNYVDPDQQDVVLAGTTLLGPGDEEEIRFTAPEEPGDYPFVCTFPQHTEAGMHGIMKVE